jgi:ABC-type Fe3+-hydroxamate transport system substrate-binding protein
MRRPAVVYVLLLVGLCGCDRSPPAAPATRSSLPTIASTVPAATDLIVGMGGGDQLVAVSTYDRGRPDVGSLPQAGDYQTVDWELLATLRPTVLLTFISPDREPAGFRERAADLHMQLLNVNVDRLADLDPAIDKLGTALDRPDLAATAKRTLDGQFDAVRHRVAGLPIVPALVLLGPDATGVAGPGTYLDDALHLAGGTNAAARLGDRWPTVDRETLLSLHPAVVLQLMPDAKPQELSRAAATWAQLPAGAVGRVCPITDPYAEQPGWHLPEVADQFARCLHANPPTPSVVR